MSLLGLLSLPVGCGSSAADDQGSDQLEGELRRKWRDSGTKSDSATDTMSTDTGAATDSSTSTATDSGTSTATDSGTSTATDSGTSTATDSGTSTATDSGTSTATDSGTTTTTTGPSIGGCAMFPADSPWNMRVDSLPLSPMASQYKVNMAPTTRLHADWGNWSTDGYGVPWQTVPSTQTLIPISFDYAGESDPGPYPIPSSPLIEGHGTGDAHMLLLQTGTCQLYEVYAASKTSTGWHGGSGAKFDLSSNKLRPDGWTSADAAGLPILPGLVRYDEVMTGEIKHAIRFTVSRTQNAFIHPATHGASSITDPSYPPMGLRLRLRASFDTSKFTGPALTILTAMKRYGVILADNGSNWYITGDSTDQWTSTLMSQVASAFSTVTGGDFEAVDTGPVIKQP